MKKRKLLDVLIAIVGALCLWLYVVTVVTPDDDITISDIPITFVGENTLRTEHNLIVTNRSARTATVTVHGSRVLLKQLQEEQGSINAILDVSMFTSERDYSSGYEVTLSNSLQDGELQIVNCTPSAVQFTVEKLASRQVNVRGWFDGTVADGYVAGDLTFDQDTLRVSGPAALVEQISYAQVLMGGQNHKATTTREVQVNLIDVNGERMASNDLTFTQELQVTLPVYLEKELELTVTPVYGAGATQENTKLTVTPSRIVVQGDPNILSSMKTLSLGTVDLNEIRGDEPLVRDILLPEGVTMAFPDAETSATISVTFDSTLQHRTYNISGVRFTGVEPSLQASMDSLAVEVTVRGNADVLHYFKQDNITMTADLTGYTELGTVVVPITVDTHDPEVFVLGEYAVVVRLQEADDM